MIRDDTPKSTDHQTDTDPSRSRRRFLKQTASIATLGLTAVAATAEPVQAGSWSRWYYLSYNQDITFDSTRWTSEVQIMGRPNGGANNDYTLIGWPEKQKQFDMLRESWGVEPGDELDVVADDQAFGEVLSGYTDTYYYYDEVTCRCTGGNIKVRYRDVFL